MATWEQTKTITGDRTFALYLKTSGFSLAIHQQGPPGQKRWCLSCAQLGFQFFQLDHQDINDACQEALDLLEKTLECLQKSLAEAKEVPRPLF